VRRILVFEDILCPGYKRLLDECQKALAAWDERCEMISAANLYRDDANRELLRLQVNFVTSYAILERHANLCEHCRHYKLPERIREDLQERVALKSSCLPN
jgi:hypothetical protein